MSITQGAQHAGSAILEVNGINMLQTAAEDIEALIHATPEDTEILLSVLPFPTFRALVQWSHKYTERATGYLRVDDGKVTLSDSSDDSNQAQVQRITTDEQAIEIHDDSMMTVTRDSSSIDFQCISRRRHWRANRIGGQ